MSLSNCPECHGTVSSFASICPHCGFPLDTTSDIEREWNIIAFDGRTFDVSSILQIMKDKGADDIDAECATVDLCIEQDVAEDKMELLLDNIKAKYLKVQNIIPNSKQEKQYENVPRCQTCGSTNIQKVSVMGRAIDGAIFGVLSVEGRAQFVCKNCGYRW